MSRLLQDGMKETPRESRWPEVHISQDMGKSTRNAATQKCLTILCRLLAMFVFCSTAWAPITSQVMSDQHSRSQMIVHIPKLRRTPTQGIASWSRRPRSAPDCNQQTPLRKCTSCTSPSMQLAPSVSKTNMRSLPPNQSMRLRDPSARSNK